MMKTNGISLYRIMIIVHDPYEITVNIVVVVTLLLRGDVLTGNCCRWCQRDPWWRWSRFPCRGTFLSAGSSGNRGIVFVLFRLDGR